MEEKEDEYLGCDLRMPPLPFLSVALTGWNVFGWVVFVIVWDDEFELFVERVAADPNPCHAWIRACISFMAWSFEHISTGVVVSVVVVVVVVVVLVVAVVVVVFVVIIVTLGGAVIVSLDFVGLVVWMGTCFFLLGRI